MFLVFPEEGAGSPGARGTDSCGPPHVGPLEKQYVPSTAEPPLQPSSRTSCRITAVLKPAQMCRKAGLPPAAGGCGAVEPLTGFYSGSDNHESPSPSMASPAERDPVWWLGCRIERQLDHRWSHLLTPNQWANPSMGSQFQHYWKEGGGSSQREWVTGSCLGGVHLVPAPFHLPLPPTCHDGNSFAATSRCPGCRH